MLFPPCKGWLWLMLLPLEGVALVCAVPLVRGGFSLYCFSPQCLASITPQGKASFPLHKGRLPSVLLLSAVFRKHNATKKARLSLRALCLPLMREVSALADGGRDTKTIIHLQ